MRHAKTLFVVGAGASWDFGFPVGIGLANRIVELATPATDADRFGNSMSNLVHARYKPEAADVHRRRLALQGIRERLHSANSIDRFIDRERHDPMIAEMGKVLIAAAISMYESGSPLARFGSQHWNSIPSWCDGFLRLILDDAYADALGDIGQGVAVICFNYDRCLEQYLTYGLVKALSVTRLEAWKIVQQIEIIHPYGTLGELPYGESHAGVPFGAEGSTDPLVIFDMARTIRTFTEQQVDQPEAARIKQLVAQAERIFFLGFGYQRQNMEMLTVQRKNSVPKKVYATGLISRSGIADVTARIKHMAGAVGNDVQHTEVHIAHGMNCIETLEEYQLALTSYLP